MSNTVMSNPAPGVLRFTATLLTMALASAADLSTYRSFQLGADLPTIAKLAATDPAEAKVIHHRPALIQELQWRPQPLGSSSTTEPVKEVVFSFYNGELFRIAIDYDRYETEGLTAVDLVEAISASYGVASKPAVPLNLAPGRYGDREEVLAQWQDSQHSFDLVRSSYGPSYKLVGVLKRLEAQSRAAIIEASRLDDSEAPQREADRVSKENESARVKLEKARLVNKPKFRP
jgi:hypothetical protein